MIRRPGYPDTERVASAPRCPYVGPPVCVPKASLRLSFAARRDDAVRSCRVNGWCARSTGRRARRYWVSHGKGHSLCVNSWQAGVIKRSDTSAFATEFARHCVLHPRRSASPRNTRHGFLERRAPDSGNRGGVSLVRTVWKGAMPLKSRLGVKMQERVR